MNSLRFPDMSGGTFKSPKLKECLAVLSSTQEVFSALRASLPEPIMELPEGILEYEPPTLGSESVSLTLHLPDSARALATITLKESSLEAFNIVPSYMLEVGKEELVTMDRVSYFASTSATVGGGGLIFNSLFVPFNAATAPKDCKNKPHFIRTGGGNITDIPPTPEEIGRLQQAGAALVQAIKRIITENK